MNRIDLEKYITLSSIPIRELYDKKLPIAVASGCLVNYYGTLIFLTVQHATRNMGNWAIELKFIPNKGTKLYQIGSMNYLKSYDIVADIVSDIDFSYVEIKENICPYYQKLNSLASVIEECKRKILEIDFSIEPNSDEVYGFAGQVIPEFSNNYFLTNQKIYTGLKFLRLLDDCLVFQLPNKHPGHEQFMGCSGAPILDSQGNIIGLVTCGDDSKNEIYGVSIKAYKVALEILIDYKKNDSKFIEYYFALKNVWVLHNKYSFGKTPDIPSGYSEKLCRSIFKLEKSNTRENDAQTKDKLFEIKATGSKAGKTTISNSNKFDYLYWLFFDFSSDILEIYKIPYDKFAFDGSNSRKSITLRSIVRKNKIPSQKFNFALVRNHKLIACD